MILLSSLSSQRQLFDKTTRADENGIRHEFELPNVAKFTWVPSKVNIADVETKSDSHVADAFRLTLAVSRIPLDLITVDDSVSAVTRLVDTQQAKQTKNICKRGGM